MTQQTDMDKTVFLGMDTADLPSELPSAIRPVAAAGRNASRTMIPYVAQQTSVASYSPGLNPLVNAASGLLLSLVRIRTTHRQVPQHTALLSGDNTSLHDTDIEHRRAQLEAEVRAFEAQALATQDIEQSQVIAARYVLCTAVDEIMAISLPGESNEWGKHGLLSSFHNETWGGEKFFQILDRCMQQPARNLYILELMYLLLSLGFEGKYGVLERGPITLEALRDKIYKQIRLLRGEAPLDLAKKVEPAKRRNRNYAYIPVWLIVAVFIFAAGVTFMGFSSILERKATPLLEDLSRLSAVSQEVRS